MDILALAIILCGVIFFLVPCFGAFMSQDPFIRYKEAWLLGIVLIGFSGASVIGIIWALNRVAL